MSKESLNHPYINNIENEKTKTNIKNLISFITSATGNQPCTSTIKHIDKESFFYIEVKPCDINVDCDVMKKIAVQTASTNVYNSPNENIWRYYFSSKKVQQRKETKLTDIKTIKKYKHCARNQKITPQSSVVGELNKNQLDFVRTIIYHLIADMEIDVSKVDFENESASPEGFELIARSVPGYVDVGELVQLFLNQLVDAMYVIKSIDSCSNLSGYRFTIKQNPNYTKKHKREDHDDENPNKK